MSDLDRAQRHLDACRALAADARKVGVSGLGKSALELREHSQQRADILVRRAEFAVQLAEMQGGI